MPKAPLWTDKEIRQLKQLLGKVPPEQIAETIGRTLYSVRHYCYSHNMSMARVKTIRHWTDAEIKFLRENAGKMLHHEIGKKLGRSRRSISLKAIKLGLRSPLTGERNHATVHSDHDVELCRALFDEGVSRADIAEKMEIPYQTVVEYLLYRVRR